VTKRSAFFHLKTERLGRDRVDGALQEGWKMRDKAAAAFAAAVFSSSRRSPSGGFELRPNPGVLENDSIRTRLAARRAAQAAAQKRLGESAAAN
jgi:hypothetical protein